MTEIVTTIPVVCEACGGTLTAVMTKHSTGLFSSNKVLDVSECKDCRKDNDFEADAAGYARAIAEVAATANQDSQ